MASEGRESYWNSTPAYFSEPKKQDFTRYFQSLDTNSSELIIIDRPRGPIFAQHSILCQRNSDRASAHIFGRCFCISRRRLAYNGKRAKVLSVANRGMGAATDPGVIRDHVSPFYLYLWHAGYDVWNRIYLQGPGAPSVRRGVAKQDQEGWMILFIQFALARRQPCDASATNLLRGSLIKRDVGLLAGDRTKVPLLRHTSVVMTATVLFRQPEKPKK